MNILPNQIWIRKTLNPYWGDLVLIFDIYYNAANRGVGGRRTTAIYTTLDVKIPDRNIHFSSMGFQNPSLYEDEFLDQFEYVGYL